MGDKTTALVFLVKDEASAAVKHLEANLNSLSNKADLGGRALHGFQSILSGIGVGIGFAAFTNLENLFSRITSAIPDLITKGLSFADTVHQVGLETGATAQEVSRFLGGLQYLGISTEDIANKLGILSKNAIAHADALAAEGINIRTANGGFLNQIQILDTLRGALNDVSGGTERQALLQSVLGKGAAGLTEVFALNTNQVRLLNAEMDKLGITMDENGVAKAEAVSKEFNLFGLSVEGVGIKLLNDVAPALQAAVDGLASWVTANGTAIAEFASNVVNFVFGMINALTDANLAASPFTSQMEALANVTSGGSVQIDSLKSQISALDTQIGSKDRAAGWQAQTKAIQGEETAVKALEKTQETAFEKAISGLTRTLDLELRNLDASLKSRQDKESQIALAQQLVDAEQALADARAGTNGVVDPAAVTSAYKQVQSIVQQQGDAQLQTAADVRKAETDGVHSYVAGIEQSLKDSTNKKALLHQLDKDAAILASKEAAAAASGNAQLAGDIQVEINAVTLAKKRAQQASENDIALANLATRKNILAAEQAAVSSAATAELVAKRTSLQGQLTALETEQAGERKAHAEMMARFHTTQQMDIAVFGASPAGAVGLLSAAGIAGKKFGDELHQVFAGLIDDVQGFLGWVGDIKTALDGIANDPVFQFLNQPINIPGVTEPAPPYAPGSHFNAPGKYPAPFGTSGGGAFGPPIAPQGSNQSYRGPVTLQFNVGSKLVAEAIIDDIDAALGGPQLVLNGRRA
jgi:biotin operon repressor